MRWFFILFFSMGLLFGYQRGDSLEKQIVQKLNLDSKKVYIIDFFASWCHSCQREIKELSKTNFNDVGLPVEIVGVDVDEELNDAKEFQQRMRKQGLLQYRVIDDNKGEIVGKFSPAGVPAIYIVKDGKIISSIIGAKDNIVVLIEKILKGIK